MENQPQPQGLQKSTSSLMVCTEKADLIGLYNVTKSLTKITLDERRKLVSIEKQEESKVQKIIMFALSCSAKLLGFGMETETAFIISDSIIENNPGLKIEDVVLALHYGSQGKYGKHYHRLDLQTVMSWMDAYNESLERRIEAHRRKLKSDLDNVALLSDGSVAPSSDRGNWRIGETESGKPVTLKDRNEFWKEVEKKVKKNK